MRPRHRGTVRGALAALLGIAAALCACGEEGDRAPTVEIRAGVNNQGGQPGFTGSVDVPVLQFGLRSRYAEVTVTGIRFQASGSGDDSTGVTQVRLYRDEDADGDLGVGDALLWSSSGFASDDGDLEVAGLSETIPTSSPVHWLLVYDIAPGPTSGLTFCVGIGRGSDVEAERGGRKAQATVGAGVQGCVAASTGTLTIAPGPSAPPARGIGQCAIGEEALQLDLSTGPREDVVIESVAFTASGTGDDEREIAGVWLYIDEDGGGTLEPTDTPLGGPEGYPANDGVVTFGNLNRVIPRSTSEQWILVYNLSGVNTAGRTFAAGVAANADVTASGLSSGQPVSVDGAPVNGEELTVEEPQLISAFYQDVNEDGIASTPDFITVTFSQTVRVTGWNADSAFNVLPGTLGWAGLSPGADPREVIISLSVDSFLQPNGTCGVDPGSSCINLQPAPSGITTCVGTSLQPLPVPVDMEGETHPRLLGTALVDTNWNCVTDAGDTLEMYFGARVSLTTPDPGQAFTLPVAGDSFGAGAQFVGGGMPSGVQTVSIELGTGAVLSPAGIFDPAALGAGSSSGVDVAAAPGLIVDAAYPWISALPNATSERDIPEPYLWSSVGDDDEFARFGTRVASAGDVNGDGYADVIVGAPYFQSGSPGGWRMGKAYLYLGGPGGLSATPGWTSTGDGLSDSEFGCSVACAGDVNGDGFSDVIVGARDADGLNWDSGKAFLYLGSAAGLATAPAWTSVGDDQGYAGFGTSVASAGDVNGDGYSDVIVGSPEFDSISWSEGKAYLYLGEAGGLSTTPIWTSMGDDQPYTAFGLGVASAGDVNGDGFSDIIIGAPYFATTTWDEGKVYVYLGGTAGPSAAPDWTSSGDDQMEAHFGITAASAGDVDGDGYSDVIIGARGYGNRFGKAYVYHGGPGGLAQTPGWTSTGDNQDFAEFGLGAASAGDVNGDGYADIIVGAHYFDTLFSTVGKAYLYLGGAGGVSASPTWTSTGEDKIIATFGVSVASAGDVNGDGFDEVIIGAPGFHTVKNEVGKAYLYCTR